MKPDYKNWMPKGMVYAFLFTFLGCTVAVAAFQLLPGGTLRTVLTIAFGVIAVVFCGLTIDTTNGKFMKKSEAAWMALSGSALLTGRK